jgi:hypothetical protein
MWSDGEPMDPSPTIDQAVQRRHSGQRSRERMKPVKLLSEQYCSQIGNKRQLEVLFYYRRTIWAVIGD